MASRLERAYLTAKDTLSLKLGGSGRWLGGLAGLVVVIIFLFALSVYWGFEPDEFAVEQQTLADGQAVTGTATTGALIQVTETLLDKPGGYISNDRLPPGLLMDNMPRWEFGVLVQMRDLARALRKDFSRSQSQSTEDPDLVKAEPLLHFNSNSWMLPSTEGEYRKAVKALRAYQTRLQDPSAPDAQFYGRADNLNNWLGDVSTRLGSLSQRLSASVGQRRLNTDLAGDAQAQSATPMAGESEVRTPWLEIDNVFYEARGTAWALIHFLKAIEQDFGPALEKKNARVSVRQIIRELEATQSTIWSPVVLNGSEFGLLANHSLVMASYISRANAAIIDLQKLLSQG